MATLTTIPVQAGTEHIRVLLTMGAGTPAGTNALSLRATESYVTQTGDAVFATNISLNGIAPHGRQTAGQGDIRLRKTGATFFSNWRNQQSETPKLLYASSADGDTVREGTEGSVGGGYWNWHLLGQSSFAQVATGDTINLVIYSPPGAAVAVVHDVAAAFALGAPGFSAVVGKTLPEVHDSAASFALGAPSFSAVLGRFDATLSALTAGFALGAPTFGVVLGKTTVAARNRAAGFALGVPSFAAVLGKTTTTDQDRAAAFELGVPSFAAVLGKRAVADRDSAAAFTTGAPSFAAVLGKIAVADRASSALFTMGVPSFSAVLIREDATTQDRETSFVLGAPEFAVALGRITVPAIDIAAAFALVGSPSFAVVLTKRIPADRTGPIAVALTNGVATLKSTLLAGGLLRSVEWLRKTGPKDVRGRQDVSTTLIDALIEQRPALDRSALDTDRADDTVLTILDPLAITDEHFFKWGGHTYRVKEVDGVIKNESTGVRFSSEVTVIR